MCASKVKVHPCTGTEALYRPYVSQGEQRYSSTLSRPWYQKEVRGLRHTPAALCPLERPGTHCTRGWAGPRAGLDRCGKSRPHRDSITAPSSPQPFAIPTTLPGSHVYTYYKYCHSTYAPHCYAQCLKTTDKKKLISKLNDFTDIIVYEMKEVAFFTHRKFGNISTSNLLNPKCPVIYHSIPYNVYKHNVI